MQPTRYGPFPYVPMPERPKWRWPNGARLAVWVIPNLEFFGLDDPVPGDSNERIARNVAKIPSVYAWGWRDYGNRVAVWRVIEAMEKYGIRGTAALNAEICDQHPQITDAAASLKWEFMGHGWTNAIRLNEMPPEEEQATIKKIFDRIQKATGRRPTGWLGSGLQETWNTLDFLIEAGCKYVADWVNDDQPYRMDVAGKSICAIPYSWEINDAIQLFFHKQSMETFEAMAKRQFDRLYEEGGETARVMAICLHPYAVGVPHRIESLTEIFRYVASREDVWFATGQEIIDAYASQVKA
jgi:allantoinase